MIVTGESRYNFSTMEHHAFAVSQLYGRDYDHILRGARVFDQDGILAAALPLEAGGYILYIAGTNDIGDWRDNFDLFGNPIYHAGFARHACEVLELAADAFEAPPAFVVGHSLGGAAAAIAGLKAKCPALTFAAPRFGRWALRRSALYEEARRLLTHIQVVGDIVPWRPSGIGVGNWRRPYWCRPGVVLRLPAAETLPISPLRAHAIETYAETLGEQGLVQRGINCDTINTSEPAGAASQPPPPKGGHDA